jgi:hypothetical protein
MDIDYGQIREILAEGQWIEADKATLSLMLRISGRETDIEQFPSQALCTIDQLWVKYSSGRFGFSVQKRIWQEVMKNQITNWETYCCFEELVGWRVNGGWRSFSDLSSNVPMGFFPYTWVWMGYEVNREVVSLLSRPDL